MLSSMLVTCDQFFSLEFMKIILTVEKIDINNNHNECDIIFLNENINYEMMYVTNFYK